MEKRVKREYVRESEHFMWTELECMCGNVDCQGNGMDIRFMEKLEVMRVAYGKPMILTSGERCILHPIEAAKRNPGAHECGCAVDIKYGTGRNLRELIGLAVTLDFEGIAMERSFLHLDCYANLPGRKGENFMSWVY